MSNLALSKDIYKHSILKKCCDAYLEYSKIQITETEDYWNVDFSDCKFNEEETMREFENYLIELSFGSTTR